MVVIHVTWQVSDPQVTTGGSLPRHLLQPISKAHGDLLQLFGLGFRVQGLWGMTQLDHVILFDSTAMSAARTALWDSHHNLTLELKYPAQWAVEPENPNTLHSLVSEFCRD